ncbi:hypothetical protein FisN_1Hh610 [Fistulifera solaris]|uniref:Pentacotripeptide-repeat region of PRORP domain-containing protein n=1 Tax=Fistulifera solaris TaxID=1519565 RepID=A0A1Z5KQP2_FISSO|nr:hypothetical protein FisN_1Hh610 [Fistulifera solaris]|eukprot:GAX28599.1 hypothetical protein FisN_1Hh610 [Fistulifera solaris]
MVVFGWGVISDQRNVAFFRMKELMQLAVEQAIIDRRVFETARANPEVYTLGSGQVLDPPLSQPDADLYNTYLVGLVQASKSHSKAAIMAEGVLHEMNRYHQELGWHTRPNTKSYGHVITAWGNTNAPEAGERALSILRSLQQTHNEQAMTYERDHGIPYDEKNPANNKRKIATADIISYTSTLKALAARQPDRAMELLKEIMQSETVSPDLRTFITAMAAFKGSAAKQSDPRKRLRAAERAEQVLWYMVDFVRAKRSDDIEKDISDDDKALVLGFNVCLDIWSKTRTREAAPRCEEILQKMLEEKIYPDVASFNACLNAWSQSANFHKDAAQRASQMLSFQHELAGGFLGESVLPDFQSYAIVIRAYSDSEKADRIIEARDLLDSLLTRFKNGDISASRNPASPFTSVITVAATYPSSEVGPAKKVKDAFMDSIDTSNDAYSIAQRTFLELRDNVHGLGASPDHHTYAAYLKCLAKHTVPGSSERELKVRIVFEEACKAGAVSRLVIEAMKEANLSRSLALAIPELQSNNNLPKFWMMNVPTEFRYRAPRRIK